MSAAHLSHHQVLIGYTCWITTGLCLIGTIAAGALLAASYQHSSPEPTTLKG